MPTAPTKKEREFPIWETVILMATFPIKITQISKDFDIKSKDVLDTFKELGMEKKSGGSADKDEFELFLAHITMKKQIKDMDAYRDGRAKIKSASKKTEAKPAEVKAPEVKAAPAKTEEAPKAAPAPKAAAAPVAKSAPAPAAKPAPSSKPQQTNKPQQPERKPQGQQNQNGQRPERDRRDNRDNRPQRDDRGPRDDRRQGGYSKYSAAPQENPFAKKIENMNRNAQGLRSSGSQQPKRDDQRKPQAQPQQKPVQAAPAP